MKYPFKGMTIYFTYVKPLFIISAWQFIKIIARTLPGKNSVTWFFIYIYIYTYLIHRYLVLLLERLDLIAPFQRPLPFIVNQVILINASRVPVRPLLFLF